MDSIHVKNLEKYHPGYKDRELQWAKIYINMASGDPDTELLNEIDWSRLVKIILLELRAKRPLPNTDEYWRRNGFDIKNRPMSLTLQMIQNFISCVPQDEKLCALDKEKNREDKTPIREIKNSDFIGSLKTNPAYSHINLSLELSKMDAWLEAHPGRKKTHRFVVNWLNKIEAPLPAEPKKSAYDGLRKIVL